MATSGGLLVLLGASNLIRDFPTVLDVAWQDFDSRPVDVLMAAGRGRCYSVTGRFLVRRLPAIRDCELWRALPDHSRDRPARALIADIGNDLMQNCRPEEIAAAIRVCVERLVPLSARPVVSLLPERSLARLRPWQFLLFRSLLYPGCRLSLARVLDRAAELNQRLRELCRRQDLPWVEPESRWFGVDGIHFRRSARRLAWESICRGPNDPTNRPRKAARRRAALRRPKYARQSILGVELRRPQPSAALADGARISLY